MQTKHINFVLLGATALVAGLVAFQWGKKSQLKASAAKASAANIVPTAQKVVTEEQGQQSTFAQPKDYERRNGLWYHKGQLMQVQPPVHKNGSAWYTWDKYGHEVYAFPA